MGRVDGGVERVGRGEWEVEERVPGVIVICEQSTQREGAQGERSREQPQTGQFHHQEAINLCRIETP